MELHLYSPYAFVFDNAKLLIQAHILLELSEMFNEVGILDLVSYVAFQIFPCLRQFAVLLVFHSQSLSTAGT